MIAALVLAAGRGGRFGGAKLLASFRGEPLVRASVRVLLDGGVDEVVVVTGPDGELIASAVDGDGVRTVPHAGAAGGMGSSLAAGIASLGGGTEAVLVALGDQPTIVAGAVAALVSRWRVGGASIVVPVYRGERGHPVLFDATVFPELRALHGDVGARGVVARDPARVAFVALDLPVPPDVDTADELAALARAEAEAGLR